MNNRKLFFKRFSISTVVAISLMAFQFASANDEDAALKEETDFSTEQTFGWYATLQADRIAEARSLADKWSVHTREPLENLFQAFYDATDKQLLQIREAQNYETVRLILNGESGVVAAQNKSVVLNKLGDIAKDLVYTPVVPCRIVDTRVRGAGGAFTGLRSYYVHGSGPLFTAQGGNPAGCAAPRFKTDPAAVHIVISANPVAPESSGGKGNVQAAPHGTAIPKAVLLKYKLGTNTTSAATVKTSRNNNQDIDIRVNGQKTHIVLDVMGYYYFVDKNDADRLAVAYGAINEDGSKASGTENVTSTWSSGFKSYHITISGESYSWTDYTTVITPTTCSDAIALSASIGGMLAVQFKDVDGASAGSLKQCGFHFVTFKNQ